MGSPRLRIAILLAALLGGCAGAPAPPPDHDAVDLTPLEDEPRARLAPLRRLLPDAWTEARRIEVHTTPPGAALELFYVRHNVQLRYARADAPARVLLPPRLETTRGDSVIVRARLAGFREREVQVSARGRAARLAIDLAPLPNRLEHFGHRALAGRGTLLFATRQPLSFQVEASERGFRVVLPGTALAPEADAMLRQVRSAIVERAEALALAGDLVVAVALGDAARDGRLEARSRRWRDPARALHGFAIDLVPPDGAARAARIAGALASLAESDVRGCPLAFEGALREALGPDALARPLAEGGEEAFLVAAMGRLGELSTGGAVPAGEGRVFRPARRIERLAAVSLAREVRGYLALLRAAVAALEAPADRREALRGVVAPELPPDLWRRHVERAERAERACAGTPQPVARGAAGKRCYAGVPRSPDGPSCSPRPEAGGPAATKDPESVSARGAPRRSAPPS